MKRLLLTAAFAASLSATLAEPLAAQRRVRVTLRDVTPILQTVTVDIASAFQQHYRAMIEPLVFGRFTIGLSGEYTTEPDNNGNIAYPVADGCAPEQLCTRFTPTSGSSSSFAYNGYPYGGAGYRAWSFNLHARWYPAPLSFSGRRQSASFYVGEFIGYHERRTNQLVYYGCQYCYATPLGGTALGDTAVGGPLPPQQQPLPSAYSQTVHGWEPGLEFGVRILPMRHLVMDVGGRFRLARIDDYQSGTRPGGVDKRLVVSIGAGW